MDVMRRLANIHVEKPSTIRIRKLTLNELCSIAERRIGFEYSPSVDTYYIQIGGEIIEIYVREDEENEQ